ncbi:hypothetical protein R3P38DRAFT_3045071 [Favolaschia claudopus]|uniref:Protein kinase domain-containing protein n=1 Tax=Favolaschia claudopus TaxID=2862362 RepID=A0AAW0A860_9AGAR
MTTDTDITLSVIYANKPRSPVFGVTIDPKADLTALKQRILAESTYSASIKPGQINLWKPHSTVRILDDDASRELLKRSCNNLSAIADRVPWGMDISLFATRKGKAGNAINLIIEFIPIYDHNPTTKEEQEEAQDTLGALNQSFANLIDYALERVAPSKAAKSTNFLEGQGGAYPLYDGRYNPTQGNSTVAPPVHLYNPAFARFLDYAANSDLKVPDKVMIATAALMRHASAIYTDEDSRRAATRQHLQDALAIGLQTIVSEDGTKPDGVITATLSALEGSVPGVVTLLVEEEKRELGEGGCDASTQASFSMLRYWAQNTSTVVQVRTLCCCPTFLIAFAGPWLAILGAVVTDKCIVQRLTDFIWLGNATVLTDEAQCHRVAHILHSLSLSLWHLKKYYVALQPSDKPQLSRFFPCHTSFPSEDGATVQFEYMEALERESACVTFKCRTKEDSPRIIVVKFAHAYGSATHELLAREGLAPQLLYCGPVDPSPDAPSYQDLKMIVMEYIDGTTVAAMQGGFPDDFEEQLTRIVSLVHHNGYVYGDLRQPNVMVAGDEVKLIDFDWAGKEGEATYPINLAKNMWPKGAQAMGLITREHDEAMLKSMVDYCNARRI